ncbi:DUF3564 domain-containing protein [Paraburkholderia diazotrophica]|uniref:DUF3564 domain-containing protein n=1 Tax=Paraburkholderia diazotrophica TaxID=667676 RepID=A0A1H7EI82_9BURK|nr:DUF3564 domain-containing protein [Paraburkholderia diazotrophica]SEK13683.1 Protein of unknown function [Paraburkholderia diazotrophica]
MRITIHLDTFECPDPAVYAILWLDRETRKWSREGHAVIDVPQWGTLISSKGSTRVYDAAGVHPFCELSGLDLTSPDGPFEGESGHALWYRHAHHAPVVGQWHVQCVDETNPEPENSVFANDEV